MPGGLGDLQVPSDVCDRLALPEELLGLGHPSR
jgi:hypothetical protein